VAIASSSKSLRQKLSDAMVDFSTPLRIVDNTAPDADFPELINFDDVARGHNADGGAGSSLLVKGVVAVRALRDFCCGHSKGGEGITLRACTPFVGGTLRRAETKFFSGALPLFVACCVWHLKMHDQVLIRGLLMCVMLHCYPSSCIGFCAPYRHKQPCLL
jgi:hypothetical protein